MSKRDLRQNLSFEESHLVEDFKETSKKINEKITIPGLGDLVFTEEVTATPIGQQSYKGNIVFKKTTAKEPEGAQIITYDEIIDGERIFNIAYSYIPGAPVQAVFNYIAQVLKPESGNMSNYLLATKYLTFKAGEEEIKVLTMVHCTKAPSMALTELLNQSLEIVSKNLKRSYVNCFAAKSMVVHFLKVVGNVVAKISKAGKEIGVINVTDENEGKKILDWIAIVT